jgi:hypothetical protein
MKRSHVSHNLQRLIVFCTAIGVAAMVPLLSRAQPSMSVSIVNNSSREIRHVYFSHVNADDWSRNQLSDDAVISPGQSFTLGDIACDQQQVRVISEDQDGCFSSTVVNCGDNATWTVTDSTPRDCGQQ